MSIVSFLQKRKRKRMWFSIYQWKFFLVIMHPPATLQKVFLKLYFTLEIVIIMIPKIRNMEGGSLKVPMEPRNLSKVPRRWRSSTLTKFIVYKNTYQIYDNIFKFFTGMWTFHLLLPTESCLNYIFKTKCNHLLILKYPEKWFSWSKNPSQNRFDGKNKELGRHT